MESFYALTILTKISDEKTRQIYDFHFRGYYQGKAIKKIKVIGGHYPFNFGSEYLLQLKKINIIDGIVHGELISYRVL